MPAAVAAALYTRLEAAGVELWVDGGWAVDALLGEQTRDHDDLDVVVAARHEPLLRETLGRLGFREVPRHDTRPWN